MNNKMSETNIKNKMIVLKELSVINNVENNGMNPSIKNAIIIGATSFIGIALIEYLQSKGVHVIAIVRPNSKRLNVIRQFENVELIESELNQLSEISPISIHADVLFYLGWDSDFENSRYNARGQSRNIAYILDAVELAHKMSCQTFVGMGSQAEYGRSVERLRSNTPLNPENAYGIVKCAANSLTKIECEKYGIKHIWLRLLSAYGPFDRSHTLVMSCIYAFLQGETLEVTKCEQTWDYVFVEDVAKALYFAALYGSHGKVYPLGSGVAFSLEEHIEIIKNQINPEITCQYGSKAYTKDQVMYLCADMSEFEEDTGFISTVSFEEGIRKTIDWVKEEQRNVKNFE